MSSTVEASPDERQKGRTGEISPAELREYARTMEAFVGDLDAAAQALEEDDYESVIMDGRTQCDRATLLIRSFLRNVQIAKVKADSGDF